MNSRTIHFGKITSGLIPALGLFFVLYGMTGCQTLEVVGQVGAAVGEATGVITSNQAVSITRTTTAMAKTFEDITPEQEYYIGRTVAATVLNKYKPLDNAEANRYLNLVGQTLAQASDRPETFGGYHFVLLDSDEINAFAAPGGLVMVSRGMIRCCKNEDALAAVLAHEIGHVENQHGLRAIRKGRLTSALTILAMEGAKNLGGQNLAEVTQAFEGSISDITSTMMNSGYARAFESQADQAAVKIMGQVGYNPEALVDMLGQMKQNLKPGGLDFAKTHPDPESRIAEIRRLISSASPVMSPPARLQRFQRAMGRI